MSRSQGKSDVLFLLGAGASAASSSQKMKDLLGTPPLGDNMGVVQERITQKFVELPKSFVGSLSELTQVVNQNLNNLEMLRGDLFPKKDIKIDNYEYLLSLIDVADAVEGENEGSADYAIRQACRRAILANIIIVLLTYYSDYNQQYYDTLAKYMVSHGSSCVSFNWDLLMEKSFEKLVDNLDLSALYGFTINRFAYNHPSVKYKLLKPHGSINWQMDVDIEGRHSVRFVEPQVGELDHRLLMAPGYFKHFQQTSSHEVLRQVLVDMAMEFYAVSRLVIIGHSLPEYDFYINYFMRRRANNIREVHILDPNACAVWDRIKNLLVTDEFYPYESGFAAIDQCLSRL